MDFVRAHPAAWLALLGRKLALAFNAFEAPDSESIDVFSHESWLLRIAGIFNFGLLAALAAIGIVFTHREWSRACDMNMDRD